MADRTPRRRIWKKNWPFGYAVFEVAEIDHLDTVTCYGFDPNEDVFAKAVKADDKSDEIMLTITNNTVQVNEAAVDDYRIILFTFGLMAPGG